MSLSTAPTPPLTADRDQIETFVDVLFRYADEGGFVQMRAFRDDIDGAWRPERWRAVAMNGSGHGAVVDAAERLATNCAAAAEHVVFAAPIATFKERGSAAEKDIANGIALTAECDATPEAARRKLESILGPATIVVASGGVWTDPATGELSDKLHLHWRLREPTREFPNHAKLKEVRRLAMILVGADGSAVPLCHPLRWPGSWHRKGEPRLACIVELNRDAEIELSDALDLLRDAVETAAGAQRTQQKPGAKTSSAPQADPLDIAAAAAIIRNDDLPWADWNRILMAIWRASGGSEAGFAVAAAWSSTSPKDDPTETRRRWDHYRTSPPTEIGAGSLFHLARSACPGWIKPSEYARRATGHGNPAGREQRTPEDEWPDPEPPTSPKRTWPTLDPVALYGLPGEVVRAIEPHTEADPVAILAQYMVAVGNAIGRGPHYRVEGDRHGPNLFGVVVGETAKGRKGTSWGRVRQVMEIADPSWGTERVHSGLSSGEGVIWAVRDPIMGYEKVGKGGAAERIEVETDPGISDKRLMVVESEFSGALTVMRREGNILSRVIRDGWDRGDLATLTKNSPARATGAHISIIGHITENELRATLDSISIANGYANRFLWLMAKRARVLPFGGALDEETMVYLGMRTGAAIETARKVDRVDMTADARAAWRRVYPALSEGKPGIVGAITARAEAQTIRLSVIFALLDGRAEIGIDHLRAALAIWEYAEASAVYIWSDALGDPIADEILRALRTFGNAGMSRTEIRDLFGRHRAADQIGRALAMLATGGKVRFETRSDTGGRPVERWFAITAGR